jgi:hypothetical protein
MNPKALQTPGSQLSALGSLGWSKSRVLELCPKNG